jgi:hypothetical protein
VTAVQVMPPPQGYVRTIRTHTDGIMEDLQGRGGEGRAVQHGHLQEAGK